jgi:hypothetical protein
VVTPAAGAAAAAATAAKGRAAEKSTAQRQHNVAAPNFFVTYFLLGVW